MGGSTYEENSRHKEPLFVKYLARVGLKYAVLHRRGFFRAIMNMNDAASFSNTEDQYVWLCYKRPKDCAKDPTLKDGKVASASMELLASKVEGMTTQIGKLERDLHQMRGNMQWLMLA